MRWLLIQAAVSMLRLRDPRTAALREWAGRIAARCGKGIAVVALARRLAGIPPLLLSLLASLSNRFKLVAHQDVADHILLAVELAKARNEHLRDGSVRLPRIFVLSRLVLVAGRPRGARPH